MKIVVTPFMPEFSPVLPKEYENEKALYFDIETTGLSAQSSYVYLIGCAYKTEQGFELTQWLCTDPSEEKELLRLFFEKASGYNVILHYNGTGFDLPFLERKAKRHCLTAPLSGMKSLDLYTAARRLRHLFSLPDQKLKTMEQAFGFTRTDGFSGQELIEVYSHFLGIYRLNEMTNQSKAEETEGLAGALLLHNAEDVKNLPSLTVLFFLENIGDFLDTDSLRVECSDTPGYSFLSLIYSTDIRFPANRTFCLPTESGNLQLALSGTPSVVTLSIPLYDGELKFFYPNPADYYYLPLEDCAMHKSVASFVEKEYRKKATAATCYSKKVDRFLPCGKKEAQKETFASLPCFSSDYKSNDCYTPFTTELLHSPELLTVIAKNLITTFL